MASLNRVIIMGRLGKEPELRYTANKAAVTTLSVATSEVWADQTGEKKERTEWHTVVVWGNQAEPCAKFLSKGKQVLVEGSLQTREWKDKDGNKRYSTEIRASQVKFIGAKEDGPSSAPAPSFEPKASPQRAVADPESFDDVPF